MSTPELWTTVRRLAPVLRPHWPGLAAAAGAALATQFAGVALLATAAWLIARAAQQPAIDALMLAIVAVRGLAMARGGFRYVERLAGHDAALRVLAELRTRVYERLVERGRRLPGHTAAQQARSASANGSTDANASAEGDANLLTGLVADVDAVQETLVRCALPALAAAVVGTAAVALTWTVAPAAAVALAVFLIAVGVALPLAAARLSRSDSAAAAAARAELAERSLDLLRGADDLAASGAGADYARRAAEVSQRSARIDRRAAGRAAAISWGMVLLSGAGVLAVLALGLSSAAGGDTVLMAVLALTALAALEVGAPLADSGRVWAASRPGLIRVSRLLGDASERCPPPTPAPHHSQPSRDVGPRLTGPLELHGVSVRFGRECALNQVDLRVPPSRSLAVVGASGAGKSTLLRLLTGGIAADEGQVTHGGRPADPESLRGFAKGLTDDAHVFRTTIRANLLLARPEATAEELRGAARRAHLLDWIESLPEAWETEVGEGGRALSGGQWRRLVLARAFLARPPLLALDEPTVGLDEATADALIAEVLAAGDVVLATHRLAPLHAADEVVVLDSGRIVQRGTPAELARVPGPYAELLARERMNGAWTGPVSMPASPRP